MSTDRPVPTVTFAEIAHLPVMVDVLTAARVLGIGRTTAYGLARSGEFPCPVVRVGGAYKVPTVGLLRVVGLDGMPMLGGDQDSGPGVDSGCGVGEQSGVDGAPDRGRTRLGLPRDPPAARA
jgi:hypothetical protein